MAVTTNLSVTIFGCVRRLWLRFALGFIFSSRKLSKYSSHNDEDSILGRFFAGLLRSVFEQLKRVNFFSR